MVQMVEYIVEEPNVLTDSLSRCYKLPFVATEALCTDIEHVRSSLFEESGNRVFERLFSIVTSPEQQSKALLPPSCINQTLAGYFNKIVSFWLIKEPAKVLSFVIGKKDIISSMFEHHLWGLTSSVTDLLVRFCTVKDIKDLDPTAYRSLRNEIL
jgi:hypothetical protein